MMRVEQQKAKQGWTKPVLKVYGTVEEVTRQVKTLGFADGIIFDIDGVQGPIPGVPIGSGS